MLGHNIELSWQYTLCEQHHVNLPVPIAVHYRPALRIEINIACVFRVQNEEYELMNWASYWNPSLFVENSQGEVKESIWYLASYNDIGQATIIERRRVKGTFFERMELMEYPFDTQVRHLNLL